MIRRFFVLSLTLVLSCAFANAQNIRKPEVAGSFYPADAQALKDSIALYMKSAEGDSLLPRALGAIIPHAGYPFSGRVAAKAYHALSQRHVRTVIVLGPSHRGTYDGAALHSATAWQTPLGTMQVDTACQREIAQACPFINVFDSAFDNEHSIEDQLPFVKQTFGNVRIVPIACGWMKIPELLVLGRTMERAVINAHDSVLIIASSDMSHYQTLSRTLDRDWLATQDVLAVDADKTYRDIVQSHSCELCGYAPAVALLFASEHSGCNALALGYSTSAWLTGDTNRVVGYGAFAFTKPHRTDTVGMNDQHALLKLARMMVDSFVVAGRKMHVDAGGDVFGRPQGVFVTIKKHGSLRGCIGYVEPVKPLANSVAECALSAASTDPRFPPITRGELPDLSLEVSLLSNPIRIRTMDDIILGTTGLVIDMNGKRGVFLPQVATEFGWSKEEFLKQLCKKADLEEGDWRSAKARIYAFTAQVFGE